MSSQHGKGEQQSESDGRGSNESVSEQSDTFADALKAWSSDSVPAGAQGDPAPRAAAPMPGLKAPVTSLSGEPANAASAGVPVAAWSGGGASSGPPSGQDGYSHYPGAAHPPQQAGWQQAPHSSSGGPGGYSPGYQGGAAGPYGGQQGASWPGAYPGQQPAAPHAQWGAYPQGPAAHGYYAPPQAQGGPGGYAPEQAAQGGWSAQPGYDQGQQWNQQWGQQAHYPPMPMPQQPAIPVHQLSSRGRRLAGALLDGFLTMFICLPFAMLAAFLVGGGPITEDEIGGVVLLAMIPGIMLAFVINAWLITRYGKTMAKFALGMRIVRTDGGPVDFMRGVIMRWLLPGAAAALLPGFQLVDAVAIFSGEKRQTLHDMLAGTQVIDD